MIDAQERGTITIPSGITILIVRPVTLQREVTIRYSSTERAVLDGGGHSRVFYINRADSVCLNNIEMINGFSGGLGGALYCFRTNIYLNSCVVTDSRSSSEGGVICITADESTSTRYSSTIENCTIINNSVSADYFYGGGIAVRFYYNSVIRNSDISNNKLFDAISASVGGGAYVCYTYFSIIENCKTNDNLGIGYGGGIRVQYPRNESVIKRCEVERNVVT